MGKEGVGGSTEAEKTGSFDLFTTGGTCQQKWSPPFGARGAGRSGRSLSELIPAASLVAAAEEKVFGSLFLFY